MKRNFKETSYDFYSDLFRENNNYKQTLQENQVYPDRN